MKGYKGKVAFTRSLEYGGCSAWVDYMAETAINGKLNGHVLLTVIEVDVAFVDTREKEIEAWQNQIEAERAESQHKINLMLGKIQELQAISHD